MLKTIIMFFYGSGNLRESVMSTGYSNAIFTTSMNMGFALVLESINGLLHGILTVHSLLEVLPIENLLRSLKQYLVIVMYCH
jgi:hypothetical protein